MNDANQDNPYRSPETIIASVPRRSAVLTRDQLYAIASWHKGLRFAILFGVSLILVAITIENTIKLRTGAPQLLGVAFFLYFVMVGSGCVTTMLGFISAVILTRKLSNGWFGFLTVLVLAPLFAPVLYLAIDLYATRVLKRHGIHVGWWGARRRDFL